jgi:hypothetical protein
VSVRVHECCVHVFTCACVRACVFMHACIANAHSVLVVLRIGGAWRASAVLTGESQTMLMCNTHTRTSESSNGGPT